MRLTKRRVSIEETVPFVKKREGGREEAFYSKWRKVHRTRDNKKPCCKLLEHSIQQQNTKSRDMKNRMDESLKFYIKHPRLQ